MSDSPQFPDDSRRCRRAFPGFAHGLARARGGSAVTAVLILLVLIGAARADNEPLPLPRYASLKSNEVNLRTGPGEDKPKLWVYQRAGMPVEIIEEFDTWRRIRDYQGVVGWVSANLLSGKRTAIVTGVRRTLRDSPDPSAFPVAEADPGVIGRILQCQGEWCRLDVQGYKGWLKRSEIWGVYPDEALKE